jgi:LEA14-like dessication related protein
VPAQKGMHRDGCPGEDVMRKSVMLPLLLVTLAGGMCSTGLLMDNKPTASVERFDIDSISFKDINLLFDIAIHNPYPIEISLDGVRFAFLIEKKQLFETKTKRGLKVPAMKKEVTRFIVNLKYSDIEKIIAGYGDRDYIQCDVIGEIYLSLPKTGIQGLPETLSFPYKLGKKVPAIKPEIAIKNFSVQKPGLEDVRSALKTSGKKLNAETVVSVLGDALAGKKTELKPEEFDIPVTISFDVELKNNTRSKMLFRDVLYDFYVNDVPLIKGETRDVEVRSNTSIISIQNRFSSKSLNAKVLKAFTDKRGGFALKGHTFMKMPDEIKKEPLKLIFDEKGNFSLNQ